MVARRKENKIYLPNKQKPFILNKIALAPSKAFYKTLAISLFRMN